MPKVRWITIRQQKVTEGVHAAIAVAMPCGFSLGFSFLVLFFISFCVDWFVNE